MPADVTCLTDSDAEFLGFPTRTESLNFKVSYVCHFQLLGQCSNHCLQLRLLRQLTSEFWVLKVGLVLVINCAKQPESVHSGQATESVDTPGKARFQLKFRYECRKEHHTSGRRCLLLVSESERRRLDY